MEIPFDIQNYRKCPQNMEYKTINFQFSKNYIHPILFHDTSISFPYFLCSFEFSCVSALFLFGFFQFPIYLKIYFQMRCLNPQHQDQSSHFISC